MKGSQYISYVVVIIFVIIFNAVLISADLAVSQSGYHPQSYKQVIAYTSQNSSTFQVTDADNNIVYNGTLSTPVDHQGQAVNCQGNQPCLVGLFTNLSTTGTYTITSPSVTATSPQFTISDTIYADLIETLTEFFKATEQQGSSYHADRHDGYTPSLPVKADGSFILTADQAALTAIRLGSAYERNPDIMPIALRQHILLLTDYLMELQGLVIEDDPDGFRMSPAVTIHNAFVPGPTNLATIDIYTPGDNTPFATRPVTSMCGEDDASASWQQCIDYAEEFYKCGIDEPCLNISYTENRGTVADHQGYAVARGWTYEFGCFIDITIEEPQFNDAFNPCLIFDEETSREFTSMTLYALVQAIPAANTQQAATLLDRAIDTHQYISEEYGSFSAIHADIGWWGAANLKLYELTRDEAYLETAHALAVPATLSADSTKGNEYYWFLYNKNRDAIEDADLEYKNAADTVFLDKITNDYETGSNSMSRTGERIYQRDHNILFHNSRFMLTEGVLALKALETSSDPDDFITVVAMNQMYWLTGMNRVVDGVTQGSPLRSYSFIFGIGDHPNEFHSRYFVDTGYLSSSDGEVVGARGTDLQFVDPLTGEFTYFDGKTVILGQTLGAMGNGRGGQQAVAPYHMTDFANGKSFIPGWINGVFAWPSYPGTIFNYDDTLETYEFTETTNEIVATAVEYAAFADAYLNTNGTNSNNNDSNNDTSDTQDTVQNQNQGNTASTQAQQVEIVYSLFEHDVIEVNQTQTIRMDITGSPRDIQQVYAQVLLPDEELINLLLNRTAGTGGYGTWEATFTVEHAGLHLLENIIVFDTQNRNYNRTSPANFYAVTDAMTNDAELELIFAVLDKNTAQRGETITISADARDAYGIQTMYATIMAGTANNASNEIVEMTLVSGTQNHGSWEGTFVADRADTTYALTEIVLSNVLAEKTHSVEDRLVYIQYEPPVLGTGSDTFSGQNTNMFSFDDLADSPMMITFAALALIVLVTIGVLAIYGAHKRISR